MPRSLFVIDPNFLCWSSFVLCPVYASLQSLFCHACAVHPSCFFPPTLPVSSFFLPSALFICSFFFESTLGSLQSLNPPFYTFRPSFSPQSSLLYSPVYTLATFFLLPIYTCWPLCVIYRMLFFPLLFAEHLLGFTPPPMAFMQLSFLQQS